MGQTPLLPTDIPFIWFALLFNPKKKTNTDIPNAPENTEQKERKPNHPLHPCQLEEKKTNKFSISRLSYCSGDRITLHVSQGWSQGTQWEQHRAPPQEAPPGLAATGWWNTCFFVGRRTAEKTTLCFNAICTWWLPPARGS